MALPIQIDEWRERAGIRREEVDERFVRGAGPGGQKVNKTSSTVWLRHLPTGIEVRCQAERSQSANRATAWRQLCEKLTELKRKQADSLVAERETERRRTRQKSRRQKIQMIETKKQRAKIKQTRGRNFGD